MSIEMVIAEELTMSYVQAGRHISGENVAIVAKSLDSALGFDTEEEVRETFKRARDTEDIPTQRVLKESLRNHRAERIPASQAITWNPSLTKSQSDYIHAWWHLRGTKMAWLTDSQAEEIVDRFESDPKNKEFKEYQHRNWTHVAADNLTKYGTATMRTRL